MDYVVIAIPFFLLLLVAELAWDWRSDTGYYRFNDTINSLSMGMLSTTSALVVIDIGGRVFGALQQGFSLAVWPHVELWHYLAAFVLYDFCYYWFHRISHERKFFWAAHVVHHQSEEYNLSTALRQTSTGLMSWVFYLPCILLGMPPEVYISVASLNLIYQFWVHTRFVPELGVLEYLLVTPSNHRVHHARNPEYIDRNYGGTFIVWDRLFGTYQRELKETPVDFGITRGLGSWNPLWANVHVYWSMIRDSINTRSLADKLAIWWGATGFKPAGCESGPDLRNYNPPLANSMKVYVLVQFVLLVALGGWLKYQSTLWPAWQSSAVFLMLLAGLVAQGWLMENRRWAFEVLRLLAQAVLLFLLALPVPVVLLLTLFSLLALFWAGRNEREPAPVH